MLRERSFAHRGGIACRMGEQDLTWEELHSRASALAAKLAEGSGPVLIYGEKSPAYVIAMVGCLWTGRPYVPAGPHYPAQRVSSMVAQANIHTAICLQPLPTALQDTVHCLSIPLQGGECFALPAAAPDDIAYILFTSGSTVRQRALWSPMPTWKISSPGSPRVLPLPGCILMLCSIRRCLPSIFQSPIYIIHYTPAVLWSFLRRGAPFPPATAGHSWLL